MTAVTVIAPERIEAERFLAAAERTRSRTSPRLAAAVCELGEYVRHQPDITLGELRAAFLGTGFVWGPDGELAFSPSRMTLVDEFDKLIEIHGWKARAAELFL